MDGRHALDRNKNSKTPWVQEGRRQRPADWSSVERGRQDVRFLHYRAALQMSTLPGMGLPDTKRQAVNLLRSQLSVEESETEPASRAFFRSIAPAVGELFRPWLDEVPSLEGVYVVAREWGYEVWAVVNNARRAERSRLHAFELNVMDFLPDVGFRFHVLDRLDQPLTEMLTFDPSEARVVQRGRHYA